MGSAGSACRWHDGARSLQYSSIRLPARGRQQLTLLRASSCKPSSCVAMCVMCRRHPHAKHSTTRTCNISMCIPYPCPCASAYMRKNMCEVASIKLPASRPLRSAADFGAREVRPRGSGRVVCLVSRSEPGIECERLGLCQTVHQPRVPLAQLRPSRTRGQHVCMALQAADVDDGETAAQLQLLDCRLRCAYLRSRARKNRGTTQPAAIPGLGRRSMVRVGG